MKKNWNKEKNKYNKKLNSNQEKDLEFKIKLKDGLQYDDENLDKDIVLLGVLFVHIISPFSYFNLFIDFLACLFISQA
jgi:hypothetical protein